MRGLEGGGDVWRRGREMGNREEAEFFFQQIKNKQQKKEIYSNIIKAIYLKLIDNTKLNTENLKALPLNSGTMFSTFSLSMAVLAHALIQIERSFVLLSLQWLF